MDTCPRFDRLHEDEIPPLYWIQHTVAPDIRASRVGKGLSARETVQVTLECGLDDVSKNEATGLRLALEVRMMVQKTLHMADTMSAYLERLQDLRQRKARFECLIDVGLWRYLNVKLNPGIIPDMDPALPVGLPARIDGWEVGEHLGTGSFGSAYVIRRPPTAAWPEGEKRVVKAMDKKEIRTFLELKGIRRTIRVMQRLSCEEWRHPGVIKLFRIYHSASHLFLVMEFGGPMNLFKRLRMRDSTTEPRELSFEKVCSIIYQVVTAVAHLHLGPEICHRDIKPENFTVLENPNEPDLQLKLVDFDLAASLNSPCTSPCGSLPFVAPEVILDWPYNGAAADIWSSSVVLLEVVCRVHILEKSMGIAVAPNGAGNREEVAKKIKSQFGSSRRVSKILREHGRPELSQIVPLLNSTLQQTFQIDPVQRWDARQVTEALGALAPEGRQAESAGA